MPWRALPWLLILLYGACGSPTEPATREGLFHVETVDVVILESFPPQALARVEGRVPDVCTSVDEIHVRRVERLIEVTITTLRSEDACILVLPPPVVLSVHLGTFPEAGEYLVRVNGVEGRFTI